MQVFLGGVRGTSTVADEAFLEFGGETTSILLEGIKGERIVLDAGTGIRAVGSCLEEGDPGDVLVLFTHYHLDHVMGLPSFGPLYGDGWRVELASPVREGWTVERAVTCLLDRPFWPVRVPDLGAAVRFSTLPEDTASDAQPYGGLEIRWCPVCHPDGCTAYRIDEPASGASVALATDLEWGQSSPEQRAALLRLLTEPDPVETLLFDGNYTPTEYEKRTGWGHSTWEDAASVAREAGVVRLLVTHHAPDADDDRLRQVEREVRARVPGAALARGGMRLSCEFL
jgi:ribonuclease BN (tRNA processing enzyme)